MTEHNSMESYSTPPRAPQEAYAAINNDGQMTSPFFYWESKGAPGYRNYYFNLNPERLHDTPTVTRTRTDRLRHVLHSLEDTCGDDFPELRGISSPQVRESQLDAEKKYLNTPVRIGKAPVRRKYVVDAKPVIQDLGMHLYEVNHPVSQLFSELEVMGEELPPSAIDELIHDTLIVLCWPQVRAGLHQQIVIAKRLSAEK